MKENSHKRPIINDSIYIKCLKYVIQYRQEIEWWEPKAGELRVREMKVGQNWGLLSDTGLLVGDDGHIPKSVIVTRNH